MRLPVDGQESLFRLPFQETEGLVDRIGFRPEGPGESGVGKETAVDDGEEPQAADEFIVPFLEDVVDPAFVSTRNPAPVEKFIQVSRPHSLLHFPIGDVVVSPQESDLIAVTPG